ncbi:MAG: hypothetical protein JXR11_06125 [Balneola sp.]
MNKKEYIKKDVTSVFGFIFLHYKLLLTIPLQMFLVLGLLKIFIQKTFFYTDVIGFYIIELLLQVFPISVFAYGIILTIDMLFKEGRFDLGLFKERFLVNYQTGILIFLAYFVLSRIGHSLMFVIGILISAKLLLAPFYVIFENNALKDALTKSFLLKIMSGKGLLMYITLFVLSIPLTLAILLLTFSFVLADINDFFLIQNILQILFNFYSVVYWVAAYMYYLRFKNDLDSYKVEIQ